jgi:hypothetical protein
LESSGSPGTRQRSAGNLVYAAENLSPFPKRSLTIAILSAIACLAIVHRAILTGLLTARLVRRETHCANRGCQDRKQDFEMILHKLSVRHDEDESQ